MTIVRLGIGQCNIPLHLEIDWAAIQNMATNHGLSAVVLDGIDSLPERERPSKDVVLTWIGDVLQSYEQRYEFYCKAIAELAKFYNTHGIKMMVLKGYSCSLDWPKPMHRPCGDIDIWLFGKQKEADAVFAKEKGVDIDSLHHHHTVFSWKDFMVENHYDFINVHHHKSNVEFEKILKQLGKDDSHYVELNGEKVYLPSPNLHALFLLKHIMIHFAAEGIMLRQILDWGFHAKAHTKEIEWDWLEGIMKQFDMLEMYNIINAICVEDLGFDASIFPNVLFNPDIKNKVLTEILYPQYGAALPDGLIKRLAFKICRWRGSAWKHELCYKENMWSAFWSGAWNHLLKPSTI